MNLTAARADKGSTEGISGASVTKPAPPGDHIPLARRCAFALPSALSDPAKPAARERYFKALEQTLFE
jgi:hypothetical protein